MSILTCGFTGYRPSKLPKEPDKLEEVKRNIAKQIDLAISAGYKHFISGFALGSDLYFAEEVLKAKKKHPHIILEAAIACETQSSRWSESDRGCYFDLLIRCDIKTYINYEYHPNCYLERNDYIISQANRLICVYDGKRGGTMYTVNRAKEKGIEIFIIKPTL
ncbi:DUF1273 domain-containing protein [Selenomonadales bacterium OttesenSCG-928-I06]|nr:DUF1273 domain-containing protein [Selenomonadales bacterium OttesenSCG-928-I06]